MNHLSQLFTEVAKGEREKSDVAELFYAELKTLTDANWSHWFKQPVVLVDDRAREYQIVAIQKKLRADEYLLYVQPYGEDVKEMDLDTIWNWYNNCIDNNRDQMYEQFSKLCDAIWPPNNVNLPINPEKETPAVAPEDELIVVGLQEKPTKSIKEERLNKLHEAMGWLNDYKGDPNEIHIVRDADGKMRISKTIWLSRLAIINAEREELLRKLTS